MIRLKMKIYSLILKEKLQKYQPYHQANLTGQTDLNNLTYCFKFKSISLIMFTGFKAQLDLYRDIFDSNIEL